MVQACENTSSNKMGLGLQPLTPHTWDAYSSEPPVDPLPVIASALRLGAGSGVGTKLELVVLPVSITGWLKLR